MHFQAVKEGRPLQHPGLQFIIIMIILLKCSPAHDELGTCRTAIVVSEKWYGQLQVSIWMQHQESLCAVFGACRVAKTSPASGVLHADGTHAHTASHTKYMYDSDYIIHSLVSSPHLRSKCCIRLTLWKGCSSRPPVEQDCFVVPTHASFLQGCALSTSITLLQTCRTFQGAETSMYADC